MKTIYDIKPAFQQLLRPIVSISYNLNITPNMVTIIACLLSVLMGILLSVLPNNNILLLSLPIFLLFRMALNAIDGILAKEYSMKSKLGEVLNELTDIVSDSFIYLPFILINNINPMLIIIVVILSIISETAGILGKVIGASRRYDGPMGKSDRAFLFSVLAVLIAFNIISSLMINIILATTVLLLIVTIFNRVKQALKEV